MTTQHGCILSHPYGCCSLSQTPALQWYTTCISAADMKRLHTLSPEQQVTFHQITLMGLAARIAQPQSECSSSLDASEVCIRMCHMLQWPRNSACNLQALPGSRFLNGSHSHAHCGGSFMLTQPKHNLPKQSLISACRKAGQGMQNACQGMANAEGMRLVHTWPMS